MPTLAAPDGTTLAYHVSGEGTPVVCLAGGPMQSSAYLGDLGGLSEQLRLIRFDYRGAGASETPTDPTSYRCDHLVDDLEAMRDHLGLDRMDLLAHCAGANLAVLFAGRYPERIRRLVLVTPSTFAVGLSITGEDRRELVGLREGEPWFAESSAAFESIAAGRATDDDWAAITPFTYGRWDDAAQAFEASMDGQRNEEAAAVFGSAGAYDPVATRADLATFSAPVLLLAGELDTGAPPRVMAEFAALFPNATLVIQPGGGHFPWLDDPAWFTRVISGFLGENQSSSQGGVASILR